jgi:hypothetical protein
MGTRRRRCSIPQLDWAAGNLVFKAFPGSPFSGMAKASCGFSRFLPCF